MSIDESIVNEFQELLSVDNIYFYKYFGNFLEGYTLNNKEDFV